MPTFHGMTDTQIGKKLGIDTQTVKAMRYNQEAPYATHWIVSRATL